MFRLFVVVSTSSVVWSQMRQFFLMRNVFCAINHDEQHESLWLSLMFILHRFTSMQHTIGLHNSLMFTVVQIAQ